MLYSRSLLIIYLYVVVLHVNPNLPIYLSHTPPTTFFDDVYTENSFSVHCMLFCLNTTSLRNQLSQIDRMYNCRKNGMLGIEGTLWRRSYSLLFTKSSCLHMQNLYLVVIQPMSDLGAKWATHWEESLVLVNFSSLVIGLSSVPDWTHVSPPIPPIGLLFSSRQRTLRLLLRYVGRALLSILAGFLWNHPHSLTDLFYLCVYLFSFFFLSLRHLLRWLIWDGGFTGQ